MEIDENQNLLIFINIHTKLTHSARLMQFFSVSMISMCSLIDVDISVINQYCASMAPKSCNDWGKKLEVLFQKFFCFAFFIIRRLETFPSQQQKINKRCLRKNTGLQMLLRVASSSYIGVTAANFSEECK